MKESSKRNRSLSWEKDSEVGYFQIFSPPVIFHLPVLHGQMAYPLEFSFTFLISPSKIKFTVNLPT